MKIYLCAPYSHNNTFIVLQRVEFVNRKAAELMDNGYTVFSPISHSHPISAYTKADACDHDFWLKQDLVFIEWCDELWIYCLAGWLKSKGIRTEFRYAKGIGKPVRFIFA